jgi:ankyrin repeat protein
MTRKIYKKIEKIKNKDITEINRSDIEFLVENNKDIGYLLLDSLRSELYDNIPILLEYGLDINKKYDFFGDTYFYYVCIEQPAIVPILLEHGADPNIKNKYENTPFHMACRYHPSIVPILLEYGADPNIKNNYGRTPFHLACEFQPSIVPILLEHGADPNIKNDYGETPFYIACRYHPSIVRILLEHGVDLDYSFINFFHEESKKIIKKYKSEKELYEFYKLGLEENILPEDRSKLDTMKEPNLRKLIGKFVLEKEFGKKRKKSKKRNKYNFISF